MQSLEDILNQNLTEIRDFYVGFLKLSPFQVQEIEKYGPKISINPNLEYHAALAFSNQDEYLFEFRPEAVEDPLAKAEEVAHYFSLILNPEAKEKLFNAKKDSEEYIAAAAQQEYVARILALEYLKHKGITGFNTVWSEFRHDRIILLANKPSDALSHFAGYSEAERDFNEEAGYEKLISTLYGNDTKRFIKISEKLKPQIYVLPPNPNYDAPYAIAA